MPNIADYQDINGFTFKLVDKKFSTVRMKLLKVFKNLFEDLGIGFQDNVDNLVLIDYFSPDLERKYILDSAGFPIEIYCTWNNKRVVDIVINRDFTIEEDVVTAVDIDFLSMEFNHIVEYATNTEDEVDGKWFMPGRLLIDIYDGGLFEYVSDMKS